MSEKSSSDGGGVLGLLGIVFIVLKLTGFIDWSWWWVTAPFWGELLLALAVLLIVGLSFLACAGVALAMLWRRQRMAARRD